MFRTNAVPSVTIIVVETTGAMQGMKTMMS
jgi:hypothetical protein